LVEQNQRVNQRKKYLQQKISQWITAVLLIFQKTLDICKYCFLWLLQLDLFFGSNWIMKWCHDFKRIDYNNKSLLWGGLKVGTILRVYWNGSFLLNKGNWNWKFGIKIWINQRGNWIISIKKYEDTLIKSIFIFLKRWFVWKLLMKINVQQLWMLVQEIIIQFWNLRLEEY
jgi:hypothetical protein